MRYSATVAWPSSTTAEVSFGDTSLMTNPNLDKRSLISVEHAFRAMHEFIAVHFEEAPTGGIPTLLADIEVQPDGDPGDPGAWSEWFDALSRVDPGTERTAEP